MLAEDECTVPGNTLIIHYNRDLALRRAEHVEFQENSVELGPQVNGGTVRSATHSKRDDKARAALKKRGLTTPEVNKAYRAKKHI